jgi:DNA-binding SARP family transcriptional activator
MWRGPALADVMLGRRLSERVIPLEEERLHVLQLRIQADLQRGLHRALIGELKSLVAAHPLNEWFSEKLISALSHAGRRSEALQAYQKLRHTLNEELGLEPGPELQRLHHEVLAAGYALVEESSVVVSLGLARA